MDLRDNRILQRMLDRLFAALVNGPSLNARPHSSRQRIDFTQLARLKDVPLEDVLRDLLGESRSAKIVGRVPAPRKPSIDPGAETSELTPELKAAQEAFTAQQAVLNKCRGIAEDARTYENDTGVHVLQIGFPMLSLPPGSFGKAGFSRRILAPVCLISLSMTAKGIPSPSIQLECRSEGADLVVPNMALLAWLENQAGREIGELEADEAGDRPWDEIVHVVGRVARMLNIAVPPELAAREVAESALVLRPCPRAEDEDPRPSIVASAVIGLFPLANQGLIRDTQAMLAGEPVSGPIEHFVDVSVRLDMPAEGTDRGSAAPAEKGIRGFTQERLVAHADPCQARAVMLARQTKGLVVHGPPGTGKSQTIANIIGDHLARGQRVLFVCDKRTALDVVMNRLEGMGLSALCAVVHDPQRDQRDLYKAIREQLEGLSDLQIESGSEKRLQRLDRELHELHTRLTDHHAALMDRPDGESHSFHELMGRWMNIPDHPVGFDEELLAGASVADVEDGTRQLHELFERGQAGDYARNPWPDAVGVGLAEFLATPMDSVRAGLAECVERAAAVDAAGRETVPPFLPEEDLQAAVAARLAASEALRKQADAGLGRLHEWLNRPGIEVRELADRLAASRPYGELIEAGPLDAELLAALSGSWPTLAAINQQSLALAAYEKSAGGFFGFLAFGKRKAAAGILAPFGLPLSRENAARLRAFLAGLKARMLLQDMARQLTGRSWAGGAAPDRELTGIIRDHAELFALLEMLEFSPHLRHLKPAVVAATVSRASFDALITGLAGSRERARVLGEFETALPRTGLFAAAWRKSAGDRARTGGLVGDLLLELRNRLASLETCLRVREMLPVLPAAIRRAAEALLARALEPEAALAVLKKAALSLAIKDRLRRDARLQAADSHEIRSSYERIIELERQKLLAVRALIHHVWGSRQKERLLATTGSRLNSAGADLRRRFMLRGQRAMRLRQVIAVGQNQPESDPLFDLRPVWMASPETVAQILPRKPLFDVIVFDEASQCRLEEALPVLLRGGRVVIAGDPRQLPPTRFFESAVVVSDQDEIETDQQLFEAQQGEIEDLLGAALNIEIDECYLDVHYRSRNSDLIEFSNQHFYGSRLQPIPGHPANRSRFAPLSLYRVAGVYEDRRNAAEADRVAQIVRDLLRRAEPPSIGVACFNINQRDLILEKLESLAEHDAAFGRALSEAWTRRTHGQFEGLFVKNLENVQGDERDHIIISTTYGPDPAGRFYRRFGPLGRAGGGRRLNVLVTRARDEVHLVSSIPASEYQHLPPVPPGQTAGGPWLLFAYLHYAEVLAELYEEAHNSLAAAQADHQPVLSIRDTRYPSEFCALLGRQLEQAHRIGAEVFWGNDGFCVDLALRHPRRADDVTIGVLCDTNRFGLAADPVEWEIFRTQVLESQGWKLHRLWTPHFFRDGRGSIEQIRRDVERFLATEPERDALRVTDVPDAGLDA